MEKLTKNLFNEDFQDFLQALNQCKVEYLLIGGYSVVLHGYPRTTGDMDICVRCTEENYDRIHKAFSMFGMPVFDMNLDNFLDNQKYDVFTFGLPPVAIDIITKCKGLDFEKAYLKRVIFEFEGFKIPVISREDLISVKKASGRPRDINDIENLKP